jgi:hypothetical protein
MSVWSFLVLAWKTLWAQVSTTFGPIRLPVPMITPLMDIRLTTTPTALKGYLWAFYVKSFGFFFYSPSNSII